MKLLWPTGVRRAAHRRPSHPPTDVLTSALVTFQLTGYPPAAPRARCHPADLVLLRADTSVQPPFVNSKSPPSPWAAWPEGAAVSPQPPARPITTRPALPSCSGVWDSLHRVVSKGMSATGRLELSCNVIKTLASVQVISQHHFILKPSSTLNMHWSFPFLKLTITMAKLTSSISSPPADQRL